MKNRFAVLAAILWILLPAGAMCDLDEMNDIELKYVTGAEGGGVGDFLSGMNDIQTENDMNEVFYEQFSREVLGNEHLESFYTEILRGLDRGEVEFKNMKLTKDGASFDIIFNNFESDQMANTSSIGFNKQYLNHRTTIDGRINHLTYN